MSDRDLGKKMVEEEHLLRFLEAHAKVTGVSMGAVSNGESPDFICSRPSGERVGIELARSPHDYNRVVWDRTWTDRVLSAHDLLAAVQVIVADKQQKRQSVHWRTPHSTILVIELLDYTFDSLSWAQHSSFSSDYADAGFLEIWLADFSTMEAYDEVRLIGLYPPELSGVHYQAALDGKPYG